MRSASRIEQFLGAAVAAGHFPGASYALVRSGGLVASGQVGFRQLRPRYEVLQPEALYDVASVTKPVLTATIAVLLAQQGRLRFEDPVTAYVPEARWHQTIRIEDLLLHTSGLPAWRPLHRHPQPFQALLDEPLERNPGSLAVYSCLDYILLGEILQRAAGQSLRQLGRQLILRPLGMERSVYSGDSQDTVPTELDVPIGQVHDRNARSLGGMPGNAGLFSTAGDLALYAADLLRALRDQPALLTPEVAREMIRPRAQAADEARAWGWMVQDGFHTSAGPRMGPTAFGHTGYTGTSLFFQPQQDWAAILLTNRVHPHDRATPMFQLRRDFHDRCSEALESQLSAP